MRKLIFLITFLLCVDRSYAAVFAVIDTNYCSSLDVPSNVNLITPFVAVSDCKKRSRGLHGDWVLKQLFKDFDKKSKHQVLYYSAFDSKRKMQRRLLERALVDLEEKKVEFILFAGGLPVDEDPKLKSKHLFLIASGQTGRGIKLTTRLWPQNFKANKIMAGFYKKLSSGKRVLTTSLLNKKESDVFIAEPVQGPLQGSSFAITKLVSFLLKRCARVNRACFEKNIHSEMIDDEKLKTIKLD